MNHLLSCNIPAPMRFLGVGLVVFSLLTSGARAQSEPSTLPQTRVVQEMHTARVDQIRTDARQELLFTISTDKTVRIWRVADLRLIRTVHLPSEEGPEGTPFAIAVSQDGRQIFVAGYTGFSWRRASTVYVINGVTGQFVRSLGRFENDVVTAMDLSPDGRRLAVGLGRGGLAVLDSATGTALRADREYGAPVSFVHHAPDGRLATAAADGCLRVYSLGGELRYRNQYPLRPSNEPQCTGGELGGVRFSPDGRWLALGTRYLRDGDRVVPEVGLFDGASLTFRRALRPTDPDQRSLCCVAWAPDGQTLFVNGTSEGSGPTPLYRVRDPESGSLERWNVGRQQFTNMQPLADGSVIFSTTAPSLSRVSRDGRVLVERAPANVDFYRTRDRLQDLLLASDAGEVAFRVGDTKWLRVRLYEPDPGQVLRQEGSTPHELGGAARKGLLDVTASTGPFSYREPLLVNGQTVPLGFEEGVRSWAVHASLPIAAIATQYALRVLDARGRPVSGWETPPILPAPAYHTVISADGRWVVVALGDGTVRWFDVKSGQQRLGLFVHANGDDWVAWRSDGYYASSPGGDQYIGWLVNRGEVMEPDFYRAIQFERTLYRPDLVRAALNDDLTRSGGVAALQSTLRRLSAPRVRIEALDPATREVRFVVEPTGRPVRELGVFADGLPVLQSLQRRVAQGEQRISRSVVVPPGLPFDRIRVEAESDGALGVDEVATTVPARLAAEASGTLWVLAVGVEKFDAFAACGPGKPCRIQVRDLPNAPNDASALAARLRERFRGVFSKVNAKVVADRVGTRPNKEAILLALRELEAARPEDTTVVFFASHGFVGGPGGTEYYLLPSDAQPAALERALAEAQGRPQPGQATLESLLSGTELNDVMRRVAGRRIVALDTCHAGAAGVSTNPYSLAKRSASAQYAVLTSSRGNELSYEYIDPKIAHGGFTYALLRALDGAADANGDGALTVDEVFGFIGPEVKKNVEQLNDAERKLNPQRYRAFTQTPMLYANDILRASRVGRIR